MGFWAAIPIIGSLLDSVFNGIDKISTTDEERLKFKQEMMLVAQPVISSLLAAQAAFDQAQAKVREAEIQSGDAFVRRTRPAMMWLTFGMWAYAMITNHPLAQEAFYAFGLIGGLFTASRGIEKGVMQWAKGKNGNGSH